MIMHCMWCVCLFPLERRYIEYVKFLQVSWKQLDRKEMLLVRNKLSLTYCICLIIIFAFTLISHTCNILLHTCRGLMFYFHYILLLCPVFHFEVFFHFPFFFYTLSTVSWFIVSWHSLSTSVSTWMTERSNPTAVLPENLCDSSASGRFPPCGCTLNRRIITQNYFFLISYSYDFFLVVSRNLSYIREFLAWDSSALG